MLMNVLFHKQFYWFPISLEKFSLKALHSSYIQLSPYKYLLIISYLPPSCSNFRNPTKFITYLFLRTCLAFPFAFLSIHLQSFALPCPLDCLDSALLKMVDPDKYFTFWLPCFALERLWIYVSHDGGLWLSYQCFKEYDDQFL